MTKMHKNSIGFKVENKKATAMNAGAFLFTNVPVTE